MKITPTKFRANIYKFLDQAIDTGQAIEIDRNGTTLKIVPPQKIDKLEALKKIKRKKAINCDPEELVHIDWSKEWKWEI